MTRETPGTEYVYRCTVYFAHQIHSSGWPDRVLLGYREKGLSRDFSSLGQEDPQNPHKWSPEETRPMKRVTCQDPKKQKRELDFLEDGPGGRSAVELLRLGDLARP